ncbi:flavin reductase [candidate division LCP-89 bacterium B3_LCP]|uniref:Flavin reductase n=1 Tax=candidate division LCP-89 bacterium B3_LCP TaxID=2012998 RepID=A0A532UYZ5_UNCL8|nr:MAG: flavin reductase [candidate division LCP-89 bacterium B3_LCP]
MKVTIPPYVHSYPAPVILIGCGTVDNPNIITCSWFGTVCSEPPMVSVSIRQSRHSFPLVKETGEFTANIPRVSDLEKVEFCGYKSGRSVNKFKELKLTPLSCPPLDSAPMIEECSLILACKVKHEIPLGSHNMFIAEVVAVHCEEDMVRRTKTAVPFPEEQLIYLDKRYWTPKLLK